MCCRRATIGLLAVAIAPLSDQNCEISGSDGAIAVKIRGRVRLTPRCEQRPEIIEAAPPVAGDIYMAMSLFMFLSPNVSRHNVLHRITCFDVQ